MTEQTIYTPFTVIDVWFEILSRKYD